MESDARRFDTVCAAIEEQPVRAAAGVVDGVRTTAIHILVVAQTTKHLVIAILTDQLVYPSATNEDVIPGVRGHSVTARQVLISVATLQLVVPREAANRKSDEHTSELQSQMSTSY